MRTSLQTTKSDGDAPENIGSRRHVNSPSDLDGFPIIQRFQCSQFICMFLYQIRQF